MSVKLSRDASELVREGRRALRPSDADKARVSAALQNRIAAGEIAPPEVSPAPISGGTAVGGKSLAKLATLTAGMVAAGVALVMYTTRGNLEPSEAPLAPTVPTWSQPVSHAADSAGATEINTGASNANPAQSTGPVSDSAAPGLEPATSSAVSARPAARTKDSDRLAEEVALLTRAQKEFHAGNFKGALAAVDQHRRKFPKGVLAQERVNLKMRTLCSMGRDREAQLENNRLNRLAPGHVSSDDVCRRAK